MSFGFGYGMGVSFGGSAGAMLSLPDSIAFTATALDTTPVQDFANILLNDDTSVTSVVSIGGVTIAPAGSSDYSPAAGGTFTVSSTGDASFDPGSDFQYLRLGVTVTVTATYVTDIGSSARLTAAVTGSLEVAYALNPSDGGSIAAAPGVLPVGTIVSLTADTPAYSIEAETVGNVTRTGGAPGVASLYHPTDGDYTSYTYLESNPINAFGTAQRVLVPAGTVAGRIAETAATNGGGYRLQVDGPNLRLTADDGAGTVLTVTRPVPVYDELFTVATALSPYGLLMALSGDTGLAAEAFTTPFGSYNPPIAQELKIGGAGGYLYGAELYSPYALTEAGLVALMNEVTAAYLGTSVDETASSANSFTDITDGGSNYRLATLSSSGSLVVTAPLDVEYLIVGGGGSGGNAGGGGGGGGAGRLLAGSMTLVAGTYSVVIGLGGAVSRAQGGNTTALGLTALGGGGGGQDPDADGVDGGSGGGARWGSIVYGLANAASGGFGYNGGTGGDATYRSGGGGGGAGGAGGNGSLASETAGAGGPGRVSTITGAEVYYGGGGGGAARNHPGNHGAGGIGGGGDGGDLGQNGTPGRGGGGGGGSGAGAGSGGSGVVYVRWLR